MKFLFITVNIKKIIKNVSSLITKENDSEQQNRECSLLEESDWILSSLNPPHRSSVPGSQEPLSFPQLREGKRGECVG